MISVNMWPIKFVKDALPGKKVKFSVLLFFSSPELKAQVSFADSLSSVVCL